MTRRTILHTIESGGPGGAETVVLNLATRLNSDEFRSIVLLPKGPWLNPKLKARGIPVYEVGWQAWYDMRGPLEMVRIIQREKVDLIHSHLAGQNFYSCIAGKLSGTKTLVTYHGPIELADAGTLKGKVRLWFVRNTADGVVVVCDAMGEVLKNAGFNPGNMTRIYNGIDTARYKSQIGANLREALGVGPSTKLVGMVANVRQSKGYEYFVRAADQVLKRYPDARFLAVGDVNHIIAEPILRLVKELSLEERVVFLGFREDIPQILSELDVFVLASTSEGFPLVTLEAMAAGKPMVITRCGGPQEVVEDGKTGFLVPHSDSDSLAEKISQLLHDKSKAQLFGANAKVRVDREFTLDVMIRRHEHLYRSVIAS